MRNLPYVLKTCMSIYLESISCPSDCQLLSISSSTYARLTQVLCPSHIYSMPVTCYNMSTSNHICPSRVHLMPVCTFSHIGLVHPRVVFLLCISLVYRDSFHHYFYYYSCQRPCPSRVHFMSTSCHFMSMPSSFEPV